MRSSLLTLAFLVAMCALQPTSADTGAITPTDSLLTETGPATDTLAEAAAVRSETARADEFAYPMDAELQQKLVAYSRFINVWRFVEILVSIGALAVILFAGWSARFRNRALRIRWRFLAVWAFTVLVLVADYLLELPFSIYRDYVIEDRYGFMNQTFAQWWGEDLLGLLLMVILAIIPVWFFYWLVRRFRRWWLLFSLGAIPFVMLLIVIVPVVVDPLFNDYVPLQDKQLEAEITALASKAGIEGADIFQVDASKQSTKINAYVTGLFGTKRIVLYDTLIKNFTLPEIKFVMGHEMGHYVKHHIWWGLAITVVFIMFALWLTNRLIHPIIRRFKSQFGFDQLADMASLPLVVIFLTLIFFVFQPVTNTWSRYIERESDRYGMQVSGVDGESAAISFDKLSVYNLSDPDPNPVIEFWFYNHPSLKKRMEFVRNWKPE